MVKKRVNKLLVSVLVLLVLVIQNQVFYFSHNNILQLGNKAYAEGIDSYTKIMLHMNGTDGSTTFTDETGKTWTANGDAQIDTAQSKFSGASGLFDGTGDYITTDAHEDFNVGSGDFTIDFWYKSNLEGSFQRMAGQIDQWSTSNTRTWAIFLTTTREIMFTIYDSSGTGYTAQSGQYNDTNWHHVEVCRDGNTLRIFVDGTADGTADVTGITVNSSTDNVSIGRQGESDQDYYFDGWIDEFRFSKGIARHTSNFTPPSSEYMSQNQFVESNGMVVMESEHYDESIIRDSHEWVLDTTYTGYSGEGAVAASPNIGTSYSTNYTTNSPELIYNVNFSNTGRYYIWHRCYGVDSDSDSAHMGINGSASQTSEALAMYPLDQYAWRSTNMSAERAYIDVAVMGVNKINLWAREDGALLDKIILTTDINYVPTGTGPAESPRSTADTEPPSVPTNLRNIDITSQTVNLEWDTSTDNVGVVEYVVYEGSTMIDTVSITTCIVHGLVPDTEYSFTVTAKDAAGNESNPSNVLTVTTLTQTLNCITRNYTTG